jgi:SAM-dependent methyltransferase
MPSDNESLVERIFQPIFRHFRPGRMQRFVRELGITAGTRILDVGGSERNWHFLDFRPNVTILNVFAESGGKREFPWIFADGCAMPFRDQSFDVAFSNSAIEHLFTWDNQQRMAAEIRRVARHYFVQTPNFWFPFDVHFLMPFYHWTPKALQYRLTRHWTPWGWIHKNPPAVVRSVVDELRLLNHREMRALFPDARIVDERFAGLSKSLIAIR